MATWNPDDYAKNSSVQRQWALELLDKLALRPHEHVLDIGCGDGRNTAHIASRVPEGGVVGIDSSREMVDQASATFPPGDHPNLRFEHIDARRLGFESVFDVVFSNATLHWVDDHRSVLLGVARCLKPGGRGLLQMGGDGNAADVVEHMESMMARSAWRSCFDGFEFPYSIHSPEDYAPWLDEAGLEATRCELLPKLMLHPDREAFAGWIRTTWMPFTERVPVERRDEFIEDFVSLYLEHIPAADEGRVPVRMVRLEVELSRWDDRPRGEG